nr:TOM1-like protein 9 [Tanacetum cinerariifolium]
MVNSMVERATSSMLIGPDWSMNTEICDICNHDPAQAKDVVKGIKKRLASKNPKVQLLALTLLETIMKNCGDFVHMHVAERDLLHEMVKIAKKKPEFHVKEKILILIDTWQETFGGARARYPQYYAAYHELLRLGAVFPKRSDRPAPVSTNQETQGRSSSYANNAENGNDETGSSAEAEFPSLSLTELQNARGIMDVLSEMLTAIDPEKKEGLRQEVIVDLVEQCRTYKQRVVHLVNSTSDESLLCQGLALNDDLQRVLSKHESLVSGKPVLSEKSKPETGTSQALVPVDAPLIDTGDSTQPPATASTSVPGASVEADLLAIVPTTTYESPAKATPKFDLLSGDDFSSPRPENSLAIVPMSQPESATQQNNALAFVDMLSQTNNVPNTQANFSSSQFQQPHQSSLYPNGTSGPPSQYESQSPFNQGSTSSWNGHLPQPQQPLQDPPLATYGVPTNEGLPPPPWEAQSTDEDQSQYSQPQGGLQTSDQGVTMYMQQPIAPTQLPPLNNQQALYPQQHQFQGQQMMVAQQQQIQPQMYPQQQFQGQQMIPQQQMYPQQMYNNNQMPQAYGYGYGYPQQQNAQFLDQRMSGLSVNNTVYKGPSMANASYVHVPSGKPTKAEDKFFGDLVNFAKAKPNKS